MRSEQGAAGEPRRHEAAGGGASLLLAGCVLALLLVLTKAATLEGSWWREPGAQAVTLLMVSWTDVLFALVGGAIGEAILLLVRRWRTVAGAWRAAFLALLALCAGYGVAAVGLFRYFGRPLTYGMLTLVGNAAAVRSSIFERVTLPLALGMIAAPLVVVAVALLARRSRVAPIAVVLLATAWVACGWSLHQRYPQPEKQSRLWHNPHTVLLRTAAASMDRGRQTPFPEHVPTEQMADFRTFGARGTRARSHFAIPEGAARPRNVIVIVLESVGTKYLRLYGHAQEFTPTLTAESQHALVFENFYAHASFTYASFRPLVFSVYPGLPWHYALLDEARPRPGGLATALKQQGTRTLYITNGDLDWGDQRWLLKGWSGFEEVLGSTDLGCGVLSSWGAEDRCAVDRLIQWIDEAPGAPFVALWWTDQTHDPYLLAPGSTMADLVGGNPKPPFAAELNRYLNVLRETDRQVARVFAALRERGLAEETLVVITGDHGEAFGYPHEQRGHAWSVYEEEVRVPLLLWNPRLFPGGQRVQEIGGHVDLNPTLADMLGVEPDREWQGYSLFDPARPQRAFFLAIGGGDIFGVREGEWKYAYDVAGGRETLFNLRVDPQEQHDVAEAESKVALQLRERVAAWVVFQEAFLKGRTN